MEPLPVMANNASNDNSFQLEGKVRERTYDATERYLMERSKPLHGLPLEQINRATASACLSTLAKEYGPVSADRCRAALSRFFGWCISAGWEGNNPVIGTEKHGDNEARDRVLSDAELAAVWNALPDSDYGRIVKLLMLTGCRREEIGAPPSPTLRRSIGTELIVAFVLAHKAR